MEYATQLSILPKRRSRSGEDGYALPRPASGQNIDPSILRESDIRGIVGRTLSGDDAYAIGRGFGTILRSRQHNIACVAYDGRPSSPLLATELIQGLTDSGINVYDLGCGPTPMLYFAASVRGIGGGIMITGSHNPPEYNGFKMMLCGESFFGDEIKALGTLIKTGPMAQGQGSVFPLSVMDVYVDRLVRDWRGGLALKVAWDPGNGAACEALQALIDRLPGKHIVINGNIDGSFPAHHPDPTVPENLEQLREVVTSQGCDLGIAFDGDGDRIGVLDGKGRILWGDHLLTLFAEEILERLPGAKIIADVKASQSLFNAIDDMGGLPIMWKTGHSLIKSKMKQLKAPLAGEMSGHIFFADGYYGFDDALYAAVRLLGILSKSPHSLASLRDRIPQPFNTPEIRIDCIEDRKFAVVEEVRRRLEAERAVFNPVDGVRVTTEDGWWLLRASNTQAILVARCEASSKAGLKRLMKALRRHLKDCGVTVPRNLGQAP